MKACTLDRAFNFKLRLGMLIGLCETYVVDYLHIKTEHYCQLCEETERKFNCNSRTWNNVQCPEAQIEKQIKWISCPPN